MPGDSRIVFLMKLWIVLVSKNWYDDGIVGVYSSKALALAVLRTRRPAIPESELEAFIDERDLDRPWSAE